jgi:flagellar protein FliO/FliZ
MNVGVVMPGRPPRMRGRAMLFCLPLLLLLLAPGESLAAAPKAAATTIATDKTPLSDTVRNGADTAVKHSSGSGGAFVRMIVGLFIVLAVIYGIYWLLKTYGKSKKSGGAPEGGVGIDVVATTAIGPNRNLHLVRVGGELVLVGSAEQAITQLRAYTPEESRRLEQQLDAAGSSVRALGDRKTSGAPPLVKLMDELRKRTLR